MIGALIHIVLNTAFVRRACSVTADSDCSSIATTGVPLLMRAPCSH